MDDDELMKLAEVIYTAWREQCEQQASTMNITLWPWVSLHRWEQLQWFTIAAETMDALAEMGQLRPD